MKQLRAEGLAYDKVAEAMNAEGLKPRTAKRNGSECKWHAGVVYCHLSSLRGLTASHVI